MKVKSTNKQRESQRSSLRLRLKADKLTFWSADEIRAYKKPIAKKQNKLAKSSDKMSETKSENDDLAGLLKQLLTKSQCSVSADNFEKIIPCFDGKTIPVKVWFENYEKNATAYELTLNQKYIHARNKMTGVAQLFLDSTILSDYESLKEALYEEFTKEYDSAEIHKMLRLKKKDEKETFHEYTLQMSKIAALGKVEESSVIKYVVEGLSVSNEAKYLLYSSKTMKQLRENYGIVEKLAYKSKQYNRNDGNKRMTSPNGTSSTADNKKVHCFNCGSTEHRRNECKTDTKCFRCNGHGHIAKNCTNKTKDVGIVVERKRFKDITVNGLIIRCLVDTGADVTIIKHSIFKQISDAFLSKSLSILRGLGNITTHPIGEFTGETVVDGIMIYHKFLVVPDAAIQHDALLGYDFMSKFCFLCDDEGFKFSAQLRFEESAEKKELSMYNIIDTNNNIVVPPQYEQRVTEIIKSYSPRPDVKCPIELNIVADDKILPFRHAPSRLPPEEAKAVKKQVEEWLQNGIVRESSSFVASRVVVVKKKCGAKRVCIDYRQLNKMVLKDCFPVPVIEDMFAKLQGASFFTVMDLENGFFHVPIEETSRKYTAFVTKEGLFEFNVAPFGFCNSPAAFIRFVNCIFQELINDNVLELYMDDIIVYAPTAEECLLKVERVLRQAEKYNLKIKWQKCSFVQKKIDFLGHKIENGEIRPGEDKVKAVKKFATPENVKAVQSFLGLTGFFRRFLQNYSLIARPLTNLLKKNTVFKIGVEEMDAVEKLKMYLTSEPILRIYCREARTELCTDASKDGFGAALLQEFEGKLHPVFFWSKKTSPQEEQRHSYILEVKAAYLAVKKFRNYLLGVRFTLVTDCAALKQTINKKDVPREVTQWILYLQDFDFAVEHRAGKKIRHADFLSRYAQNVFLAKTDIVARIKWAQQKDGHIKAITEILKERQYENYIEKGGLLYRAVNGNDVLVVPKCMEYDIIKESHNVGHFAHQKTIHALQQQYWIPHLERKVGEVIKNCVQCILYNKKLGKKEGFLHYIDKGDLPLHTLHIDHLGPMDTTSKMYKYILAVVDGFTKFIWLYPTKSTGCEEVLRKLEEWSNIFGKPTRIISDHGSAFTANAFKAYVEENSIAHVLTTTGVARGNGQIERVNRLILSVLSKLSADDTRHWYKFVNQVQVAINSSVHSSTKVPPF